MCLQGHYEEHGAKGFDLGDEYTTMSRGKAAVGSALVRLQWLVPLSWCQPSGRFRPRQLASCILVLARKNADINNTGMSNEVFANWLAKQMLLVLRHFRTIRMRTLRYRQCLKSMSDDDAAVLESMLGLVGDLEKGEASDSDEEVLPDGPPRKLQKHESNASSHAGFCLDDLSDVSEPQNDSDLDKQAAAVASHSRLPPGRGALAAVAKSRSLAKKPSGCLKRPAASGAPAARATNPIADAKNEAIHSRNQC